MKRFLIAVAILISLSAIVVHTQNAYQFSTMTVGGIAPVVASSPGAGLAHFAGGTQTATSSAVTAADATGNTSGTGNFCLTTSCVMTTPNLGTPSAINLANATNVPIPAPSASVVTLVDEFAAGATSSGNIGSLGWEKNDIGSSGVVSSVVSLNPNMGIINLATAAGATAGQGSNIFLTQAGASSSTQSLVSNLQGTTGWDVQFIFKLAQSTTTRFRIGLDNSASTVTGQEGLHLRYDTNASFADTDFIFESLVGGVATTIDSTIPVDLLWHRVEITSTVAGTAVFTLYSASGAVQATKNLAISIVSTTNSHAPWICIATDTTAQKSVNIDYMSFYFPGLAR